jgi:hypothetical protein
MQQISRDKFDRFPRATTEFTLCVLDRYGLRDHWPARPTLTPQIRFLYIGSRFCSTLPSDPASRRRPCASLSLHLYQVVKRTCTSQLLGVPMTRTVRLDLPSATIQLISLEDFTARTARLVLDLAEGIPVLSKHARDFLGFVNLVNKAEVETVWQDHRKPNHPMTFQETISLIHYLIPTHQDLLVTAKYSKDTEGVCPRCSPTPTFQLANPNVILSLLAYC